MKKFLYVLMAAGSLAAVTSCSKDYSCHCEYNNGTADSTFTVVYTDVKKSEAEEACTASQAALTIIDANATCHID